MGPDGRGCEEFWKTTPPRDAPSGWWKAPEILAIIRAHEMTHITPQQTRVLAECAAKRAIIKQHEQWPVLVESEPSELEQVADGLNDITYRMTRQMAWLTTKEYIKRFGTEPPTAPIIATLAAIYTDHPDYRQEWAPDAK